MLLQLARHQVTLGYLQFLGRRITWQFDDFEPVPKRGVNRVQPVRRGDEQHAGQVERQIEVVVGEGAILLRVEDFQQCRCRVATKVRTDLVHFIQQHHRVVALDAAQALNDPARERPNVSATMPANLRLVAHAAERNAGELPAQCIAYALAQRGFAYARRADQAKNRPLQFVLQLDDRQELQQAVLYFAQSVVLLVENVGCRGQINFVLGRFRPGETDNPVQVIPRDGIFRSGRGDLLQTVQFLERDLLRVVRKIDLFNLLAQGADFGRGGIRLAKFTLNSADLLTEE